MDPNIVDQPELSAVCATDSDNPQLSRPLIGAACGSGRVIWITGLSGAGKSTLARAVSKRLGNSGASVVLLDGDELRSVFGSPAFEGVNLGRAGRLELASRYGRLCQLLAHQGLIVVIATISMFHEVYEWNRQNLSGYFEAYLKIPVNELRKRDPKGIYRLFDAGRMSCVAGMDLPVDEPFAPDWLMDVADVPDAECLADSLLRKFYDKGRL